jgi:hypothetical protein
MVLESVEHTALPREADLIRAWRAELDSYFARMRNFAALEPDEIFKELSAMSARASEVRGYLVRSQTRLSNTFRTQEIDFFLTEADRQFKLYSRITAIRTLDWEMARGA